jgi:nitric-oxide synthase
MSTDAWTGSASLRRRLRRLTPIERQDEAVAFVTRHHRELGLSDAARRTRVSEVERSLRRSGSYVHTPDELAFGARVAWRNHARCIGRLYWESLEVYDQREVSDPDAVAALCLEHLRTAAPQGRVRSMITICAPAGPTSLPAHVESRQLVQYAGWLGEDGRRFGDAANIEVTRIARSLGWNGPDQPGRFDLLPLVVRDEQERRLLYDIPADLVQQVEITHPTVPAIGELGLRWYAVPVVSSMVLTIGGIDYPCAPFNGFYLGTEIASRDLADEHRFDALPEVARALGEDPTARGVPLWKDRTLTELNLAVLHSYGLAGVTVVDHHTASRQYLDFVDRERAAGREPSGNWSWIVPPQASAACPVFHTGMVDRAIVPNFYHSRAADGADLGPEWLERDEPRDNRWTRWRRRQQRERLARR